MLGHSLTVLLVYLLQTRNGIRWFVAEVEKLTLSERARCLQAVPQTAHFSRGEREKNVWFFWARGKIFLNYMVTVK